MSTIHFQEGERSGLQGPAPAFRGAAHRILVSPIRCVFGWLAREWRYSRQLRSQAQHSEMLNSLDQATLRGILSEDEFIAAMNPHKAGNLHQTMNPHKTRRH